MGEPKKLTAFVNTRSRGLIKRWPAYAVMGHWAITVPCAFGRKATPELGSKYATMTHQPTGYRSGDILLLKDYTKVLLRMNKLFGNARTVAGVTRKFAKLSQKDKNFVRGCCKPLTRPAEE